MPEPTLSDIAIKLDQQATKLDQHVQGFDAFVETYTQNHAELVATLADHTKRLERIEHILWDGARLAEMERRIIKLAEHNGLADLAIPFSKPIGV